ncbi:DUF4214 domain-containing protein [Catenulispora rubra]|uniref:DUF4214 domain-containing protein n=1 Tax=Catenulispora rubra TaxID=280293 RepID=UPI0018922473|nr:DUF4214 domain-containing protein [Catenulispora rubra]
MLSPRLHRPARAATAALLLAASAGAAVAYSPPRAAATTLIPYQFIAKTYTEGLGRVPDQAGWGIELYDFQTNGCTAQVLAGEANRVLESAEFANLNYSNPAKIEVAYRTILNREPDSAGYTFYLNYLNGGSSWASMLTYFEASPEFTNLAATICSTPDYGFGTGAPIALSPTGTGYSGTEAGLQSLLNSTPYGGTVNLAERALIPLTSTLVVPAGVALTTYGEVPSVGQNYAELGRLARQPGWSGESVHLSGGANLNHVWVDGDRLRESGYDRLRFNIIAYGGSGTTIQYDRIGNTAGATDLELQGVSSGYPCSGAVVSHNLVDAYTSTHNATSPSDGISDGCEGSQVTGNGVVDASDVAIILFAGTATVPQASTVSGNSVVQSGHGANALLATDGSTGQTSGTPRCRSRARRSTTTRSGPARPRSRRSASPTAPTAGSAPAPPPAPGPASPTTPAAATRSPRTPASPCRGC